MKNLTTLKENNLNEARELIRKSLGLPADTKKPKPKEENPQETAYTESTMEQTTMFGNRGRSQGSGVAEEIKKDHEVEKAKSEENKRHWYTLPLIVGMVIFFLIVNQIWNKVNNKT